MLLGIILAACSSPEHRLLKQADSIITDHPDSAMAILSAIDPDRLGKRDLPYYALLHAQAQVETGNPAPDDSLINVAYEKYGAMRGDKGIRANFYLGESLLNKATNEGTKGWIEGYLVLHSRGGETLNAYIKAYEEAKRLGDDYWIARSAHRLKHLFVTVMNHYLANIYAHEEITHSKKANMVKENRKALAEFHLGNTNPEGLRILDSLRTVIGKETPCDSTWIEYLDFCIRQNQSLTKSINEYWMKYGKDRSDHVDQGKAINSALWKYYNDISERNAQNYRLFRTLLWVAVIVFLAITGILTGMFYFRNKAQKTRMASDLESFLSLKADSDRMTREIEENTHTITHLKQELEEREHQETSNSRIVRDLLADKWNTVGMLCDQLFDIGQTDADRKRVIRNIEKELKKVVSPQGVAETVKAVDRHMGGLITSLREECPFLKEEDVNFLGLIYAGFSVRAVCMFTGMEYQHFYVKKSRLMKRIQSSDAPDRELFVERMQRK